MSKGPATKRTEASADPGTARPTFAELAAEVMAEAQREGFAPNTLRGYRAALDRHLLPEFGNRPVADLGPTDIAELISALRAGGLTENGIVDVMKPLRKTLSLAERRGLIDSSPYDGLDPESRPRATHDQHRILTLDEIDALAAAADEPTGIAIGLALFCGLRNAEARALKVRDLDPSGPTIAVARQTAATRGRRETGAGTAGSVAARQVDGLGDAFGFLRALGEHVDASGLAHDDHLIRSPTGRYYDRGNFSRRYATVIDRAGLTEEDGRALAFEQLRNNFAALGARIGTNPIELLRQLGKSHTASLQRLTRYFQQGPPSAAERDRLRAAARRLAAEHPGQ